MISREEDFFYLGKILKLYGKKGHLLVMLDVDNPTKYHDLNTVFLDLEHEKVPFFIETSEIRENKRAIFKFRDTDTPEHAEAFIGRHLYLPLSALPKLTGTRFYYHEVKGFTVVDHVYGKIGKVEEVLELSHQPLLRIFAESREILIPAVDEIIKKVDRKGRMIFIEAPEGLIDIYR